MLTGQRAFDGRTNSDVVVKVLEHEPDWKALPAALPERIRWLLRRCLAKDSRQRLHDIADARLEIDEELSQPSAAISEIQRVRPRERLAWAIAAVSLLGLAAVLVLNRNSLFGAASVSTPAHTASILLPDGLQLSGPASGRFALSPDGAQIAVVAADASGTERLYIRRLNGRSARALAGTDGAEYPFWSPDSRFVAFLAEDKLKKVDVNGGDVATLADASLGAAGSWNRDDVILFTPRGDAPLFRVSANSGMPVEATSLVKESGESQHSFPFFLPDGRHFLFFVVGSRDGLIAPRGVYLGSLDARTPIRLLIEGGSNAQYANGHVFFLRNGSLFTQRFDSDLLQLQGEVIPLATEVQTADRSVSGVTGAFTVSQTGVLAYQAPSRILTELTWFDRQGKKLSTIGDVGDYTDVAISPDGGRVVTSVMDPAYGTRDLWTFDGARGLSERLTFGPGDDFGANWSADGTRLFFSSRRQGGVHLYEKAADSSIAETLVREDDLGKFNPHPSPDGQHLIFVSGGGIIMRSDIWVLARSGTGVARAFIETPFVESQPQFSPDGRWVAFMSNKSGRPEVYVTTFPRGDRETRVSVNGGSMPRWNRNNREIFYVAPDATLTTAAVDLSDELVTVSPARPLFRIRSRPGRLDAFPYAVAPAGDRILLNAFIEELTTPITLVVNWQALN